MKRSTGRDVTTTTRGLGRCLLGVALSRRSWRRWQSCGTAASSGGREHLHHGARRRQPAGHRGQPGTNTAYVANCSSANVSVFDGATNLTTTVAVGSNPLAVGVNPVTDKVYVANYAAAVSP